MEKALRATLKEGRFEGVTLKRSRIMRSIKGRGNRDTEVRLRLALVRRGVGGWRLHQGIRGTRPDFYFAGQKIAVFVDGCFWHGCPTCGHIPKTNRRFWTKKLALNKKRDLRHSDALSTMGVRVIRLWEHEVLGDADRCVDRCLMPSGVADVTSETDSSSRPSR